ncbi:thyrotropin-releasing hormone receptor-like [Tubulanus polymorphus]|uniref:thyrotropin-releasing hormone receptor-like n=1 Tax=Tubulanus polymorphus TaxID=672921 RepID=UPI003DA34509
MDAGEMWNGSFFVNVTLPPPISYDTNGSVFGGPSYDVGSDYNNTGMNLTNNVTWDNSTTRPSNVHRMTSPPMYYILPYRIIGAFFCSVIFIVGLTGNVMVVIVVSRTKTMHTTTNCYLVSLAVADILVLLAAAVPTIVELVHFMIIDQWLFGMVGCALLIFTQYVGVNISALSITAFTIERYIAICHPMKAQTMCTVKRAKRIIACLWIFGLLYNAAWLGLTTIEHREYPDGQIIDICTFKLHREDYTTIYMADLVIFYVIPLILTCVLYGLIGRILFSSTIPKNPGKTNGHAPSGKKSPKSTSRVQVIKMLAVVVGMFATLWMPYRVWVVYNSFSKKRYVDLWFKLFCRLLVYMNSAINPILYNAMSMKFRRAFKRLLSCGKQSKQSRYRYVTTTAVTTMQESDL